MLKKRYSKLRELEKFIRNNYKDIEIPHLTNNNWFYSSKTKVIESRMILIENFLQVILQNEKIISSPNLVLDSLNLPLNFYNYISKENQEIFNFEKPIEKTIELNGRKIFKNENIQKLRMSTTSIIQESRKTLKNGDVVQPTKNENKTVFILF